MTTNILQHLGAIGISEKEMRVYFHLLSVEAALPMEVAKATKLKRSTVYIILDFLKEKRLIREIQHGKRLSYTAEEPERLNFLLEEAKLKLDENAKLLATVLPQLKAIVRKHGEPPLVRLYEGEAAVQASMEELAANPKFRAECDYGIFPLELVYKLFRSKNLHHNIDFRLKNNQKFNVLYTAEEGEIKTTGDQHATKIDGTRYPLSCDISIFEDEVRIHMLGKTMYGIAIKNLELAQTLISLFKLAEKGAAVGD